MESGTNSLYELRKEMGKSQTFVGDSVCISQSTMSLYENGAIIPSDALVRLESVHIKLLQITKRSDIIRI